MTCRQTETQMKEEMTTILTTSDNAHITNNNDTYNK